MAKLINNLQKQTYFCRGSAQSSRRSRALSPQEQIARQFCSRAANKSPKCAKNWSREAAVIFPRIYLAQHYYELCERWPPVEHRELSWPIPSSQSRVRGAMWYSERDMHLRGAPVYVYTYTNHTL
jgi:hypothetical protein